MKKSLKGEDFCGFFGSVQIRIRFFCLLTSLPSHLRNSTKLTDFSRFIPSCSDSMPTTVSGIVIDSVRTKAVTTRPSRIGLDRFFEPCCRALRSGIQLAEIEMRVEDPDTVVDEGDKFIKKSWFRKMAHVQDLELVPRPTLIHEDPLTR